jgi:hypothetical protein
VKFKEDVGLRIELSNDKSEILELFYNIIDIDISDRWIGLIKENLELQNKLKFNYRKFHTKAELKKSINDFKKNIEFINQNYDRKLPDIVSFEFLQENQYLLNDLHTEFEIYGDRLEVLLVEKYFDDPKKSDRYNQIWPGDVHNKVLHESFLRLNEQIHNFELLYRKLNNPYFTACTCLIDFYPPGIHEPLKNEDYFLFDPNQEWGFAYLGYNTLGKHWHSSFQDNDIEAVYRKHIRPQQRFAAEFYLNFVPLGENFLYKTKIAFYNWWVNNRINQLYKDDLTLRDFAFGYIPIAKIYGYYTNNTFTHVNKKTNKISFNKKVWSKFDKVISVNVEPKSKIIDDVTSKTKIWK